MTTLAGPKRCAFIEDAPQQWTAKSGVTIWEGSVVGSWPAGATAGFLDLIEADPSLVCRGVCRRNIVGGTSSQDSEVDEKIIPLAFAGGLDTTKRGVLVYATDTATGTLSSGTPPIGMLMEVVSATRGMVGIGPSFIARAAAASLAVTAAANNFQTDEITNAAAVLTTALLAATATVNGTQTVLAAALVAAGLTALAAYPRNVTFTGGSTTASCPTSALITGTDSDGNVLTETLALSSGSGVGVKAFKTVVSIVMTGGTATSGTEAIGIGGKFGLSKTIKLRAGIANVVNEMLDGAYVDPTTATIVSAATAPPHGTWAPADPPDGTDAIAITYEHS